MANPIPNPDIPVAEPIEEPPVIPGGDPTGKQSFDEKSLDAKSALAAFKAGAAAPAPDEVTPPEPKPEDKPKVDAAPPEEKPKVDEAPPAETPPKTDAAPPENPLPEDPFPDVQLGPHARPTTAKAFEAVKQRAALELKRLRDEAAAKESELKSLRDKPAVDPAVEEELKSLRAFRESVALEGDPIFAKKFDEPAAAIEADIFARLKATGKVSDADIAEIKKIGVGALDWPGLLAGIPTARLGIERKLTELDGLKEARAKALGEARTNLDKAIAERREVDTKRSEEVVGKSSEIFGKHISDLPMLKKVVAAPTDSAEKKAEIAARNAVLEEAFSQGKSTLGQLDTPEGRGEAAAIVAVSWVLKSERDAALKQLSTVAASTKALEDSLASAKAELKKAADKIAKFEKSGSFGAPKDLPKAPVSSNAQFEDTRSALDRFKQTAGT